MKTIAFLIALAAITLPFSTYAKSPNSRDKQSKHHGDFQKTHDYYPQKPQYQPAHKHPQHLSTSILGNVLGHEIAKDYTMASELDSVSESYLGKSPSKSH